MYIQNRPEEGHKSALAVDWLPSSEERELRQQVIVTRYKGACIWALVAGTPVDERQLRFLAHSYMDGGANWQTIDLAAMSLGPSRLKRQRREFHGT